MARLSCFVYLSLLSCLCSAAPAAKQHCKVLPGDAAWPSFTAWEQLNRTVEGRLIATVPEAAVCHRGGYAFTAYNESSCSALQAIWNAPETYEPVAGAIMNPYYQNQTCVPFTPFNQTCTLGKLVSYSINVASADDVAAGIRFAEEHNIRLVIKNTGHDFTGGSTGEGALALWMWNLNSSTIVDNYTGIGDYHGPAITLGAGMAGYEAYYAANARGYRIVGGDCPTVGITGGYAQGGGHSLLTGTYGMASDQVLEWEVVTANGSYLVATPFQNADLYWAMSGGGGGTYAVALSMTYKIYPESIVGSATLSFNATANSNATFTKALEAWWKATPGIVDGGASVLWGVEEGIFLLEGTTAPGLTAEEVGQLFAQFRQTLGNLSVQYTFATTQSPSYFDHFSAQVGGLPYGEYTGTYLEHSWLVPRELLDNPDRVSKLSQTMINVVTEANPQAGDHIGCQSMSLKNVPPQYDNAVFPSWRDTIAICLVNALWNWSIPYSEMLERKAYIAHVIAPAMQAATPGGGSYRNEVDSWAFPQADTAKWQRDLFGVNYHRLREIKRKWDPASLFYANIAVGSEDWVVAADGRLCRA